MQTTLFGHFWSAAAVECWAPGCGETAQRPDVSRVQLSRAFACPWDNSACFFRASQSVDSYKSSVGKASLARSEPARTPRFS